jgi:Cu(I)/Ag(I) efflux system protein CusF
VLVFGRRGASRARRPDCTALLKIPPDMKGLLRVHRAEAGKRVTTMLSRPLRTLFAGVLPLALAACTNAPPAAAAPLLGIDLGSSGAIQPAVAIAASPKGEGHEILPPSGARIELVHEGHGGASATGTVNSVDLAGRKVNVSHGAIQALGWPPMTMDFPVASSVHLGAIKSGAKVNFTLDKGSDGMPVIDTIAPAGGGK